MLFPTAVVGSLPRPKWLLDLFVDNQNLRVIDADLEVKLERAVDFEASMQEAAGLEIVSDAEPRRIGYLEEFIRSGAIDIPMDQAYLGLSWLSRVATILPTGDAGVLA